MGVRVHRLQNECRGCALVFTRFFQGQNQVEGRFAARADIEVVIETIGSLDKTTFGVQHDKPLTGRHRDARRARNQAVGRQPRLLQPLQHADQPVAIDRGDDMPGAVLFAARDAGVALADHDGMHGGGIDRELVFDGVAQKGVALGGCHRRQGGLDKQQASDRG